MNTCKHCFCANLHWVQHEGKWRLAYEGGQLHRCIGTRATLAKSIPKPKAEFWDLKALEKWRKRQPVVPAMPSEWSEEWYQWLMLDGDGPKAQKVVKTRAAQQEILEMVP